MIGDVLSILGTTLMTNVIRSLGENKEQPRTEIVERQVMVPQQPQISTFDPSQNAYIPSSSAYECDYAADGVTPK